ncbi:MAG: saccharopine dehydrogenase family protein [Janthinobacterium lividum]
MTKLMIYGASGYTGRMATEHAKAAGLDLVLAGRSEAPLAALGSAYRVFQVDDHAASDKALSDVSVLLNCAGPFMRTAKPLMEAAIRSGVHYLDIAAELDSYRLAKALDMEVRAAGVMLLPGSGGSVVMLGCLAGHAVERVADPRKISIALLVSGSMSRGSAISATENLTTECLKRVDGTLVVSKPEEVRDFDFGNGLGSCFALTLPDLITIWENTHIPDIETFVRVSGDAFPTGDLSGMPDGPTPAQRDANRYRATVEVTGDDGRIARSVLDTVNGYSFTPLAAAEAARRVLGGEVRVGFQTPAGLFGNGFAETIADTRITDLQ